MSSCEVPNFVSVFMYNICVRFSGQIFIIVPNIKFHNNLSSGRRADTYRERTGGRADMTTLTGAFRNYANSPRKEMFRVVSLEPWHLLLYGTAEVYRYAF
jgi:hypothetical protein